MECVHTLFERQVRRNPQAVALVAVGGSAGRPESLTYHALNTRANRLARYLGENGVAPGDRVGLRMARSIDCVVAMLGILKAGGAYVPLEQGFPAARLNQIVTECGIAVVLADAGPLWPQAPGALSVLRPDAPAAATRIAELPGTNPAVESDPERTMFVPFTSGSTGLPKGSDVPHRSLPGFFAGEDYADWGPGFTGILHSALSWDGHLLELYPSLLTGGRVAVAPAALRDPTEICAVARELGVTTLWLSAQAFNTVIDVDPHLLDPFSSLIIGGEALSVRHVRRAFEEVPHLRIVNGYGPSECSAFTCVHPISAADLGGPDAPARSIPIGRAVGDRRVYILDDDGRPVADGEIGELYVGGPAVAHCYVGRPRLTAERFGPDPFAPEPGATMYRSGDRVRRRPQDGLIEFHGRLDGQVKLRGFRVELTEVEAVLRAHPEVADCAVALDAAGPSPRLVAYVVPTAAGGPVPEALDRHAREQLHAAMVPGLYVALDRLPLSRTGKLDRSALPAPAEAVRRSAPYRAAGTPGIGIAGTAGTAGNTANTAPAEPLRTATERKLAETWAPLLGVPAIGPRDRFFDLGGDSLLASRAVARVRTWADAGVTVADLYDTPELAAFAALLDARRIRPDAGPAVPSVPLTRRARVAL